MEINTKKTFMVLKETVIAPKPIKRGYAMRKLYINVGTKEVKEKPVSEDMKKRFVGGKGFGLKLLWDATKPGTRWNDAENEINIAMGPVCGNTNYPGSGKSLVVSISPITGVPIDSNVGGYFGPYLKFGGWDALELQGKADKEILVYIDSNTGKIQLLEAPSNLPGDTHLLAEDLTKAFAENEQDLQSISVISSGRGADHTYLGLLNFSLWDKDRKSVV